MIHLAGSGADGPKLQALIDSVIEFGLHWFAGSALLVGLVIVILLINQRRIRKRANAPELDARTPR